MMTQELWQEKQERKLERQISDWAVHIAKEIAGGKT